MPAHSATSGRITHVKGNGSNSACVTTGGELWVWGYNYTGQVCNGTKKNNKNRPVRVQGIGKVEEVAVGYNHVLALTQDGAVYSWGSNEYGQLGIEGSQLSAVPVKVSGLQDVVGIAAGSGHSIALKSDGTVWCWGDGRFGQLGDGTRTSKPTPVKAEGLEDVIFVEAAWYISYSIRKVGSLKKIASISCGTHHALALSENGDLLA